MRQYRGLTKDGKWVYGDYIHSGDTLHYIVPEDAVFTLGRNGLLLSCIYSVIPETVGQSTNLKDKNGTEIYSGDKLTTHRYGNVEDKIDGHVRFEHGAFVIGEDSISLFALWLANDVFEIIGDIRTKPELLEKPK